MAVLHKFTVPVPSNYAIQFSRPN